MLLPSQFKSLVLSGNYKGQLVNSSIASDPEDASDNEDYQPLFLLSNSEVDRHGNTVNQKGWELASYLQNPIVLFNHNHDLPIGKAATLEVKDASLKARVKFAPKGISSVADQVQAYVRAGILKAVSVGFLPLEWSFSDDPARKGEVDFLRQELIEFSIVSVPALPTALIEDAKPSTVKKTNDLISLTEARRRRYKLSSSV